MNVIEVLINAISTPFAKTPKEGTTAPVKKDTLGMDIIAQVCLCSCKLSFSAIFAEHQTMR